MQARPSKAGGWTVSEAPKLELPLCASNPTVAPIASPEPPEMLALPPSYLIKTPSNSPPTHETKEET